MLIVCVEEIHQEESGYAVIAAGGLDLPSIPDGLAEFNLLLLAILFSILLGILLLRFLGLLLRLFFSTFFLGVLLNWSVLGILLCDDLANIQ